MSFGPRGGGVSHRILNGPAASVEEHDMSVAVRGPAGGDWLDACCWRCGSPEPLQDSLGRLLCPPCRAELSDDQPAPPDDPLRVVRSAYWDTHVLERCWRCLTEGVDPRDEVGLCAACLATLVATDEARQEEGTGR
jgi:hypothetical protein